MARLARLTLVGQLHHVMQRGINGQAIVADDADRTVWLRLLTEHAESHRVALHAYVLTESQFQVLLTPESTDGVSGMMQSVGRSYVRYFNNRHGRRGTLWEGRYRSTLIQPERHLLACMVYLDLQPVRAGWVDEASHYAWSSHCHHIGLIHNRSLTPHAVYWRLGNTPFAREAAYAGLVRGGLTPPQIDAIERAVWNGWALGDAGFVAHLQQKTGRRMSPVKAGRPPKIAKPQPSLEKPQQHQRLA
jgi:putative transposase